MDLEVFSIFFKELIICYFFPFNLNIPFPALFQNNLQSLFSLILKLMSFQISWKLLILPTLLLLTTSQILRDKPSTNFLKLYANCKSKPSTTFLILYVNFKSKNKPKSKKSHNNMLYLLLVYSVNSLYIVSSHVNFRI